MCVILAGGRSSRMGRDKAMLPLETETFLSHLVKTYRAVFPVYVSVDRPGRFPMVEVAELADLHPGNGPLAGLESAFAQTDADVVFLTATDLPFGSAALALRLQALLGEADACVIRRQDGGVEPTFALYRRSCARAAADYLAEGQRSFYGLLQRLRVRWVEESELPEFALDHILKNVNTPEEYDDVLAKMELFP